MSLKEKVDFSEAKRVLEQLQQYIKEKCLQEEQKKNEQGVQEIPLASQPTMLSDHLGEESFLQPLEGQVLSADNNDNNNNNNNNNNSFMMATDQPKDESLITPANQPQDAMMKFDQSMGVLEKSQIENNAYTNVGLQDISSDIGNNDVINDSEGKLSSDHSGDLINKTAEEQYVQENNLTNSLSDTSLNNFPQGTEIATTGNLAPDNNVSITQTEVPINQFRQEKLEQPDFIQTQQSETVGIAQNEATKSMNNVEIIPEIVMPNAGFEDDGTYQASANGAQAVIQDVTPAVSDTSVVLPNGITEEIANEDTLVVGPDSFGPSR